MAGLCASVGGARAHPKGGARAAAPYEAACGAQSSVSEAARGERSDTPTRGTASRAPRQRAASKRTPLSTEAEVSEPFTRANEAKKKGAAYAAPEGGGCSIV